MIVFLDISTFRGFGGIHYYGRLQVNYDYKLDPVDVTYTLDAHAAARFNKDEPGAWKAYRPGDTSSRFDSIEDLIRHAKKQWREAFPDGQLLIRGSTSVVEPQPIIDGDDALAERLNAIPSQCEELGWWDGKNTMEVERLCDQWFAALAEQGFTEYKHFYS